MTVRPGFLAEVEVALRRCVLLEKIAADARTLWDALDNEADVEDNADGIANRPNDAMRYQLEVPELEYRLAQLKEMDA